MSAVINREEEAKNLGMENDHLRGVVHPLLGVHELDS
jgi:hypothetical protein